MRGKAFLLLIVFLLNTLVGYGCALQIGFHSEQSEFVGNSDNHSDHDHGTHDHESPIVKSDIVNKAVVSANGTCCQDGVNKFNNLSKQIPSANKILLKAPVSIFASIFLKPLSAYSVGKVYTFSISNRQRPPTIPIRIFIRTFQI